MYALNRIIFQFTEVYFTASKSFFLSSIRNAGHATISICHHVFKQKNKHCENDKELLCNQLHERIKKTTGICFFQAAESQREEKQREAILSEHVIGKNRVKSNTG